MSKHRNDEKTTPHSRSHAVAPAPHQPPPRAAVARHEPEPAAVAPPPAAGELHAARLRMRPPPPEVSARPTSPDVEPEPVDDDGPAERPEMLGAPPAVRAITAWLDAEPLRELRVTLRGRGRDPERASIEVESVDRASEDPTDNAHAEGESVEEVAELLATAMDLK